MYEGKELVELLNETTASGYVYAISPKMKALLDKIGDEKLGEAMPEQQPANHQEREQIAQALSELGKANGLDGEDIEIEIVKIPAYWFESGWDYNIKWPESFDIRKIHFDDDIREYDGALAISNTLPEGECVWGFGFNNKGTFMISTVSKEWNDDADVENDMFSAYAEKYPGIFKLVATGKGEDAIQDGVTWNGDLDKIEKKLAGYAH